MQIVKHIIERLVTSKEDITTTEFSVEIKGKKKEFSIVTPKDNPELLLGNKTLALYADYLAGEIEVQHKTLKLGLLVPHIGDLNCEMCEGVGTVTQGQHDDIEEVPCPCTISDPADFSGATEGDR